MDNLTLQELNQRRCAARLKLNYMGASNAPIDADKRIQSDAQYILAKDFWLRAEEEYNRALAQTSTEQLMALAEHKPAT